MSIGSERLNNIGYLSFATSYTDRTFPSALQFKSVRVTWRYRAYRRRGN